MTMAERNSSFGCWSAEALANACTRGSKRIRDTWRVDVMVFFDLPSFSSYFSFFHQLNRDTFVYPKQSFACCVSISQSSTFSWMSLGETTWSASAPSVLFTLDLLPDECQYHSLCWAEDESGANAWKYSPVTASPGPNWLPSVTRTDKHLQVFRAWEHSNRVLLVQDKLQCKWYAPR